MDSIFGDKFEQKLVDSLNQDGGIYMNITELSMTARADLKHWLEGKGYSKHASHDFTSSKFKWIFIWGFQAIRFVDCYLDKEHLDRQTHGLGANELTWKIKQKKQLFDDIWSEA